MRKLLAGTFAAGMVTSAAVFMGDGTAAADTALIVPGTAPSPYGPLRSLYHFNPATQPEIGQNFYNPAATRVVIPYPGSFWPVTGVNSPTVGKSVQTGTNNLDGAIRRTNGPIYAAGLSQGTLALDQEQARLAADPHAPPPDQLTFIKAGDPNNLLRHVFRPGTHVPLIDYTVPGHVESQYNTVNVVGQYDIFSDPPTRMGNLLADLNGITAGGYYGHSATAFADPRNVAPGDITTVVNSRGATETTYLIRSPELPMVKALVDMAGLPPEAAGPLNAVLKPMVDRAYGPDPGQLPSLGQIGHGAGHLPQEIGLPIEIPLQSVNGTVTAVTVATRAATAISNAGGALPLGAKAPVAGVKPPLGGIKPPVGAIKAPGIPGPVAGAATRAVGNALGVPKILLPKK
jgi:3'-(hydroxy)phthioceranyl-2'-palmitoyl(stearoyl)-2-O-sulfo-trehalose (hydroxy)phthioceranyltransferase